MVALDLGPASSTHCVGIRSCGNKHRWPLQGRADGRPEDAEGSRGRTFGGMMSQSIALTSAARSFSWFLVSTRPWLASELEFREEGNPYSSAPCQPLSAISTALGSAFVRDA